MALSNEWNKENSIYKLSVKGRDMSRLVYIDNNGFEAFVVSEDKDSYRIVGNGVKCSVWKKTTKNKIKKVSSDYILRKHKVKRK